MHGYASTLCILYIPRLFLQNEMGLHEEFDTQPQSTWSQAVHLLAYTVPQVQPQVLPLASRKLQAKVVHLNDPQLSAYLHKRKDKL